MSTHLEAISAFVASTSCVHIYLVHPECNIKPSAYAKGRHQHSTSVRLPSASERIQAHSTCTLFGRGKRAAAAAGLSVVRLCAVCVTRTLR